MNERDTDQEILDEIERQIAEGTDLDDLTPVKAKPLRNPRATFSVRLSPEEMQIIGHAARERGAPVGDYIRDAALASAEHDLASKDVETMDLAEVGRELERLRKRVDAVVKSEARARAGL